MIDLDKIWLDEIKRVLKINVPEYKALAFGSRTNGTSKKYSDLDIALVGRQKLDWRQIEALKDIFSESNIPIIIDIVDFNSVSKGFQKIINSNYEIIKH